MSLVRRAAVEKGGKKQRTCGLLRFLSLVSPEKSTLDMQLECFNTENPNLQWFCQDCKQSTGSSPFLDNREVARNSCAVSAPSRLTRKGLLAVFPVVVVLNYGENDCSDSTPIQTLPRVNHPMFSHLSTTALQFIYA